MSLVFLAWLPCVDFAGIVLLIAGSTIPIVQWGEHCACFMSSACVLTVVSGFHCRDVERAVYTVLVS